VFDNYFKGCFVRTAGVSYSLCRHSLEQETPPLETDNISNETHIITLPVISRLNVAFEIRQSDKK
jgi:hypothetical protein